MSVVIERPACRTALTPSHPLSALSSSAFKDCTMDSADAAICRNDGSLLSAVVYPSDASHVTIASGSAAASRSGARKSISVARSDAAKDVLAMGGSGRDDSHIPALGRPRRRSVCCLDFVLRPLRLPRDRIEPIEKRHHGVVPRAAVRRQILAHGTFMAQRCARGPVPSLRSDG